jgi:RNA polymerase sigma-70 factor (ECF subfamily)
MLGDFQRVRRWAETDDVLQNALVRLVRSLKQTQPQTSRDFLALASVQIRRELIDLARHYYGPQGIGANHESQAPKDGSADGRADPADVRHEPASMAQWTEMHEQIDRLGDEDREIVGLLFYQGLSQAEASEVLNVSLRTVQRRWHDALCKLHRILNGDLPS